MKPAFVLLLSVLALGVFLGGDAAPEPRRGGRRGGGGGGIGGLIGGVIAAKAALIGAAAIGAVGLAAVGALSGATLTFGKRSAEEEDVLNRAVHMFDLAGEFDSKNTMCLAKVVCESASKGKSAKTLFDNASVTFAVNALKEVDDSFWPQSYGEAVLYGAIQGYVTSKADTCRKVFPSCVDDSKIKNEMEATFNKMEKEALKA